MKQLFASDSPLKIAAVFVAFVVLVFLTWLLYKSEGKNLAALGLQLTRGTVSFLPIGLIVGILFLSGALFLQTLHDNTTITANPNADYLKAACGVFLLLQGVINE